MSNGTEVTEFFVTSLSSPWAFFASYGIPSPDIIKNSANIETSLEHKSDWVKFILMSILFWLCLGRILLYFYAKRILNKVINNSLLNESEFFFNCIRQSVKMKLPEESLVKSININENRDIFNINNYNDYSILCYRIAKVDIKRIKVDLNNSFLKDKVIRSQDSFSLYGKEKEEESMISSLANIVLIFINPVSNPDESFKNKLKKILSFNIQKIWIIPLIEENEYYKMMNNGHMKYKNWKKLTKEFKEVSLFNE